MDVHIKRDFAASVRCQLDRYPVWDIGLPFELGDFGILKDKTLQKLGNIREFGVTFSTITGNETPYQFASQGTSMVRAQTEATIQPNGLPAPIRASVELGFNQERGLFITALKSRVLQMSELRQVALKLRDCGRWKYNWKFVSELREVDPGTVIMGSSAGTTLKVEGSSDLLEQFNIGALKLSTGLSFTGQAALQVVGIKGPIFLDLSYLPLFFGGDLGHAAVSVDELSEEPYVRLRADVGIADDA